MTKRWLGCGSVVVDFLFIVTPIVGVCNCSMFCCTLLYVHFSIAIILMGKRELIALLNLSSWCLVMVERLFLTVPRGCLQFVIVVFPDHTHLLFLERKRNNPSKKKFCYIIEITHVVSCIITCRVPGKMFEHSAYHINIYWVPRMLFEHVADRLSVQTSSEGPGKC